jgi:hypothetical protein
MTSTTSEPGYCSRGTAPATGDHTQVTLLAPAASKIACTWRHARAYSPAWLPLARSDHGYQRPFISWAKRSRIGLPYAAIALAQRLT